MKPEIKVFITKDRKFRVEIQESGKSRYAVTVGGKEWENGCGREHAYTIFQKMHNLTINMFSEFIALKQKEIAFGICDKNRKFGERYGKITRPD